MKTAVDYLQDEILQDRMIKAKSIKEWHEVISKAREIQEQQNIDYYNEGYIDGIKGNINQAEIILQSK